ncbi:MAG: aldehyde dehydrogenase family protein, partial [Janthinobacterium lividum]
TGVVIERFAFQGSGEVERLLAGAEAAFRVWRDMPVGERARVYVAFAATLRARAEEVAGAITREMGKVVAESRAEVEKCAATAEWFAAYGPGMLADEPVAVEGSDAVHVAWRPVGLVLGIMPWNFPLWQAVRAAVPVMLSGNGFVLKAAPNVMRCAFLLRDAWEDSGLPRGLFCVLNAGNDAVAGVIEDRRVAGVTLTGSARAGAAVAALAGRALKKSVLELGGVDPFVVLADADLDAAVAAGVGARFGNAGQVCLAAKRFIVEAPVVEAFAERFVAAARRLRVGDPFDPATDMGPMAREDLRDGVHEQVTRSVAQGARLLLGGRPADGPGWFYEPTVLGGVRPGMAAFEEEVFGPVAALVVARDAEDALGLANDSEYGLSGSLWTADLARAGDMARRMETGGVFVNGASASNPRTPVGGVKKSGYGRELSHFGVREFANAQTVWVKAVGPLPSS